MGAGSSSNQKKKEILTGTRQVAVRTAGPKSQLQLARERRDSVPQMLKVINRFKLVNHKSVSNVLLCHIFGFHILLLIILEMETR